MTRGMYKGHFHAIKEDFSAAATQQGAQNPQDSVASKVRRVKWEPFHVWFSSKTELLRPAAGFLGRLQSHGLPACGDESVLPFSGCSQPPSAINNLKPAQSFAYSPRVDPIGYVATVIAAYFLGSVPTGFLAGKSKGIDIRASGSGNIGATNATRALGKKIGIIVLIVDALKGFAACRLAPVFAVWITGSEPAEGPLYEQLAALGGFCAILGHNFTCWLKFKGGKGIATTCGALLALMPDVGLISIAVWLLVLGFTRYVSIASIAAAIVVPISSWATNHSSLMTGVALVLGTLAIFKHRDNIRRLVAGTEQRLGQKKSETSEPSSSK